MSSWEATSTFLSSERLVFSACSFTFLSRFLSSCCSYLLTKSFSCPRDASFLPLPELEEAAKVADLKYIILKVVFARRVELFIIDCIFMIYS